MDISPGLGSALSGLFTAIGAVGAVLIAQALLRSKVTDIKSAISETEEAVSRFREEVESELVDFKDSLGELSIVIASLQETTAKTQAAVRDQSSDDADEAQDGDEGDGAEPQDAREKLFEKWYDISDHLEEIASSPAIDGRTRARYGRIDRRSYYDLIEALGNDGLLHGKVDLANEAAELWYSCRRRNEIDQFCADEMNKLAGELLEIPIPE